MQSSHVPSWESPPSLHTASRRLGWSVGYNYEPVLISLLIEVLSLVFAPCVASSMEAETRTVPCIHHYSILQNNSAALNILWAPPVHPSLPPPNPWEPLVFSVSSQFCLSQNVI